MNTTKTWRHLITGLTTLAVVSFGSYTLAEDAANPGKDCKGKHGFHQHIKGDRHAERITRLLELTDDQKQTLAAHKSEQRAVYREQRQQVNQAQRALRQAVNNNAGEAEISQLTQQLGELNAQQTLARAKDQQFFLAILTAEQKEKMEQLKSERKNRWRDKKADTKV